MSLCTCHPVVDYADAVEEIEMLYRLAIVEDNATARANLRSHILPLGQFDISSFSNGTELKAALKKQNFELILMDFHLGQSKTGVEWIQELRQSRYIKPSTGIIFITSDRMPQTIGQIIDVHPDLLIIKPYTIGSITRAIMHYIDYREYASSALFSLDNDDPRDALAKLTALMRKALPPKIKSDVQKLKARLLIEAGQVKLAKNLYDSVLERSEKVLWAQWGKIKCEYINGDWQHCTQRLHSMVTTNLAKDKALEWLAGLSFEQQNWNQTEYYLEQINVSDLSIQATKLKSIAYQKQDKVIEGIDLLQRKRDVNRAAKDKYTEFTFELAAFYLNIAEHQPQSNREQSLMQAKRLVGVAGRNQGELQLVQKRDYLLAHSALLEGDEEKARHYLSGDNMQVFVRTDPATLLTAAKVYSALGDKERAKSLVVMAQQRNQKSLSIAELVSNNDAIFTGEINMGIAEERAAELNEEGTLLFVDKKYAAAMDKFYLAFQLMPEVAAFPLNLLQCMVEAKQAVFKRCHVTELISSLQQMRQMSAPNLKRFEQLQQSVAKKANIFLTPPPSGDELPPRPSKENHA
ncbi:response regulator [Alteromonas ponticola]|uniref:Response regulator n=1 Tax=Alteromonas aquimaris TaxID=2998417 RepID=A0ABT3P6X9_9ALTE|nr:response regulator [Alteromonas aquimaris]MCW8108522.1 response regulator [Alteromonas aquimaris]